MNVKITILLAVIFSLSLPIYGKTVPSKTVAILETVDAEGVFPNRGDRMLIYTRLGRIMKQYLGFKVYDRENISSIIDEHNFQRSGLVDESKIKRLGEMIGVDYVLYTEMSKMFGGRVLVVAKLMNVETAEWEMSGEAAAENINAIETALREVVRRMIDSSNGEIKITKKDKSTNPTKKQFKFIQTRDKSFDETALGLNMKMVWVEGGEFLMGATSEQGSDAEDDEKVIRRVRLNSFYIGESEITQAQWERVMGTSIYQQASKAGDSVIGVGPDYPMYYVSWEEAQAFCQELSRITGRTYCLPTEAQWEYAARGGKKAEGTKYSGSWSIDAVAWYYGNSSVSNHPVKHKRANALGLYDMSGSVSEWCADWYGTYNKYDKNNPTGPSSGSSRVLRGGGWIDDARDCRVSFRGGSRPGYRSSCRGFRVALLP